MVTNGEAPQVRVAVIGCGYWGKNLVRNFAELGALAAICDPDRAAAAQFVGALWRAGPRVRLRAARPRRSPRLRSPRRRCSTPLWRPPRSRPASMSSSRSRWRSRSARPSACANSPDQRNCAADGRASAAVPPGVPRAARPGARGRARPAAVSSIRTGSTSEKFGARRTSCGPSRRTTCR